MEKWHFESGKHVGKSKATPPQTPFIIESMHPNVTSQLPQVCVAGTFGFALSVAVLRAFIQRRFSCCCCLGCSACSSIAAILRVCSTGWQPPARACTQRATSCALRLSCSTAARLLVERLSRAASTTLRLCHAQAFCAVRGRFH